MDSPTTSTSMENLDSRPTTTEKAHDHAVVSEIGMESLEQLHVNRDSSSNAEDQQQMSPQSAVPSTNYFSGWRLHGSTLGCLIAIFLVNLEVSIVSTAIIAISSEFKSYDQSSWIVTGFLAAYTAFLIIGAKLADILTYKSAYLGSFLIFLVFSGACGGAQTMQQLIAFRVFQGLGAAGTYSNTILFIYALVPPPKWPLYASFVVTSLLTASVIGPIIGGAIVQQASNWRWVFYINLPLGFPAAALLQVCIPSRFPYQGQPQEPRKTKFDGLARIDYLGATLLAGGIALLLVALFEGSTVSSWSSATSIGCFCGAGGAFIAFFFWERHITLSASKQEPMFPWRFFKNPAWMGMLLITFIVGFPFSIIIINFPQSFQILDGLSPLQAGIRLLPYLVGISLAAMIANMLCSKFKMPFIYILLFGACLQTISLGLLITTTTTLAFPGYGYFILALAGCSIGGTFSILLLATPVVTEKRDLAVATGSITQFRFLSAAIGLAIATAFVNYNTRSQLQSVLNPSELGQLLQDPSIIQKLPIDQKLLAQNAFLSVYREQFILIASISAVQIFATALIWRKKANGGQYRPL